MLRIDRRIHYPSTVGLFSIHQTQKQQIPRTTKTFRREEDGVRNGIFKCTATQMRQTCKMQRKKIIRLRFFFHLHKMGVMWHWCTTILKKFSRIITLAKKWWTIYKLNNLPTELNKIIFLFPHFPPGQKFNNRWATLEKSVNS